MKKFPITRQYDAMDCGPASLSIISKYYGKDYPLQALREYCNYSKDGVSMFGISEAAELIGFKTIGAKLTFDKLATEAVLPCIIHWNQNHFVVVYKITKSKVYISDPAHGLIQYSIKEFMERWINTKSKNNELGACLIIEPTTKFFEKDHQYTKRGKFRFIYSYLKPYKRFLLQLLLGLITGSFLQLIFPFLTQAIVDKGIINSDINFIYLVLIAQLVLFVSQTSVEFIRSWILLHVSTRINIALISDFLIKLMKLPIGFFDTKMIGDIMQRIGDHRRIELFLTSSTLNIIFSMINLIIFGIVLAIYNLRIFLIFIVGSILYMLWVFIFMKKRRELDYKRFSQMADNQTNLYQMITGIQEIKQNNCERKKRWTWEKIQAKLFKISIKSLSLSQYQQSGSVFVNQTKNILITFFAAEAVITGKMTLGMMMAVQYIIGQLNGPIDQLIMFFHSAQDAKISLERLGEIHQKEEEEFVGDGKIDKIGKTNDITISDLSFQYPGPLSEIVLKNINLTIPRNKVTAIVGMSGSGKTTLVKMILGFYSPIKGKITIGGVNLNKFSNHLWRSKCGVVLQDGFLFSDSIAENISLSDDVVDGIKLHKAAKTANIHSFISSLPLSYNTKIGMEGHGLSEGQKQRILIARAIYKNPEYLFFDEATNALDATNEKIIIEKLNKYFKKRTVVIVAHRLSTVKNADQIVVLEKGKIAEIGNHNELVAKKGLYYSLIKNQLELGK